MTYLDKTFCNDWCGTTTCHRNFKHIEEATAPGGYLAENTWMPISFFMDIPKDCDIHTPKRSEPNVNQPN